MAFNERELKMVEETKELGKEIYDVIQKAIKYKTKFEKEFTTGQSNELSAHETELTALGLAYDKLSAFYNQVCQELEDFRDGVSVATRDRNKDIVEVME